LGGHSDIGANANNGFWQISAQLTLFICFIDLWAPDETIYVGRYFELFLHLLGRLVLVLKNLGGFLCELPLMEGISSFGLCTVHFMGKVS
jgi:hypothetical protein